MTETRCIQLNGQEITYLFKRSKRRSIGLKINHHGLTVSAPFNEPLTNIEFLLAQKTNWLLKHLTHRESRQSTQLNWKKDRVFPLLGQPWHLMLASSGNIQMAAGEPSTKEHMPITLTSNQIEKFVMAWYDQQAITYFNQRAERYAHKLGVPLPPIKLSRAKTRWGSCNSRGVIHLNWRLIQMPSHLVDYVIAHELSHLIEMNHSPAFWCLVGDIYPDYLGARKELKRFGC